MISRLDLTVIDASTKAPLPGVTISLKELVSSAIVGTQTTDAAGKTTFNVNEGVWKYTVFKGGYQGLESSVYLTYPAAGYKIELIIEPSTTQPPTQGAPKPPQIPTKPGEPLPLDSGDQITGTIGTRCDYIRNTTFPQSFFTHRDRYTGQKAQYSSDNSYAQSRAAKDAGCYLPAPPTAADWQDGIQKQLTAGFDALSKYITDGLQSKSQELEQAINGIWDKLESWIIERIVGILLKALDNEVEKNGR
jgi:hypothetical protein